MVGAFFLLSCVFWLAAAVGALFAIGYVFGFVTYVAIPWIFA
jgi:hypothetical protein